MNLLSAFGMRKGKKVSCKVLVLWGELLWENSCGHNPQQASRALEW